MATTIRYFGHSAFEIKTGQHTLLLDPFITGNELSPVTADELDADVILVSHGHEDHVGDTINISKSTGALVIANFEISTWFGKQGVEKIHSMHIGGQHQFEFGQVKLTIAHHGSMLPDGTYGGNPCGMILKLSDTTIYFAGDTGLFYDMTFIGEEGIDIAILPIGDNYTMGPDDSIRAIKMLSPQQVIPCHFNTWPVIAQDSDAWAKLVSDKTTSTPSVLTPGDTLTVETR